MPKQKRPFQVDSKPRSPRARTDGWSHEEFLAACLEREVAARQSNGGEIRIRAARFPARKTLEDFDFDHQRSLKRDVIAHLGALDFVEGRDNVVFLGACPLPIDEPGLVEHEVRVGGSAPRRSEMLALTTRTSWARIRPTRGRSCRSQVRP